MPPGAAGARTSTPGPNRPGSSVVAGAAGRPTETLIDGYAYGSLSMACYTLGADCADATSVAPAAAIPSPGDVPIDQSNL